LAPLCGRRAIVTIDNARLQGRADFPAFCDRSRGAYA
jgi:hypothetical protein